MKVSKRLVAVAAVAGFFQVHNAFAISISEGLNQSSGVDVSAPPGFPVSAADSTSNLLVDMTGSSETTANSGPASLAMYSATQSLADSASAVAVPAGTYTASVATFTLAGQAVSSTVLNAQTASEPEGAIIGINDTGAAPEPASGAMLAAGAGLLLAYLLGRSKARQGRA